MISPLPITRRGGVNLYDMTKTKAGMPEENKVLDINAGIKTENEYVRHKERVTGANAMHAQFVTFLEGLEVDKNSLAESIYKWSHGARYETIEHKQKQDCDNCNDLAKAIAQSDIIREVEG